MKFLFVLLLFLSGSAFADECNTCYKKPTPPKPKVVTIIKKEEVKTPCCEKPGNVNTNTNTATSTTGNQTVTVNVPAAQPTRIYKIVHLRGDDVVHRVYVYRPNRILFNLGMSRTKLDITTDSCECTLKARKKDEFDAGLQYLRDFGHATFGIQGTIHENRYISIGFNF